MEALKIDTQVDIITITLCCNVGSNHEETEHRVKDDFERNKIPIDPTEQPR